jgi:hypothetical protein
MAGNPPPFALEILFFGTILFNRWRTNPEAGPELLNHHAVL